LLNNNLFDTLAFSKTEPSSINYLRMHIASRSAVTFLRVFRARLLSALPPLLPEPPPPPPPPPAVVVPPRAAVVPECCNSGCENCVLLDCFVDEPAAPQPPPPVASP